VPRSRASGASASCDAEFSLLRTLLADLPKSRTPWELLLRAQLTRALAAKRAVSWSRPTRSWLANQGRVRGQAQAEMHARSTRRMPWEPGHSALSPTPRLVLVLDISGSIDAALLERFVREVQAIVRRTGAGLTLVVGDMAVRHVRHLLPHTGATDLLASLQVEGGGGTDFTPLLQEAEAHAPDLILVLTDLEGPARTRPKAPVIWAVPPQHAAAREPFGRLVVLE
jgi:predicted metal-dependent peptidase